MQNHSTVNYDVNKFQKQDNSYLSGKRHEMLYHLYGQKNLPIRGVIVAYADSGHCTHFDFLLQIL